MSQDIIARFKATDLNDSTMQSLAQNRVLEFIKRHEISVPTKDFVNMLNTYCAQVCLEYYYKPPRHILTTSQTP
jgi:hypothetical protein